MRAGARDLACMHVLVPVTGHGHHSAVFEHLSTKVAASDSVSFVL